MKKHFICMAAIVIAIAASSFTSDNSFLHKKSEAKTPYRWFDFNGGLLDQWDPTAYTLDPNNFPDCQMALGLIYCEIYAIPSGFDPMHPDLGTITSVRMRPLL